MNKNVSSVKFYLDYVGESWSRIEAYRAIKKEFNIKTVLYPGSYVHITPSLIFPEVIYMDTDKKANSFFTNREDIWQYINHNKEYSDDHKFHFLHEDYRMANKLQQSSVDLIISEYAGFVSLYTKPFLKKKGILIAGDSHGDGTMANSDTDFKFLGVLEYNKGHYFYKNRDKGNYFTMNRNRDVDFDLIRKKMKGPKYSHNAAYYIFQKIGGHDE